MTKSEMVLLAGLLFMAIGSAIMSRIYPDKLVVLVGGSWIFLGIVNVIASLFTKDK